MQCPSPILLAVACLAVQYFSTLSRKQHDFEGKGMQIVNYDFLHNFSSEIFLSLRRFQLDIIIGGVVVKALGY